MVRGRPPRSVVRERIQQVVDALGASYGYEIYKVYREAFGPVELRLMYYHLGKGLGLDEFIEVGVKEEKGDFTWGGFSIRKYYVLGPAASHFAGAELHGVMKGVGLKYRDPKNVVSWGVVLKERERALGVEVSGFLSGKSRNVEERKRLENKIDGVLGWLERFNVKGGKGLQDLKKQLVG